MIAQGTPEWHAQRLGKATASKIADIIARAKSGYSASRANYAAQLLVERLTNTPTDGFTNAAMAWGNEQEPFAREAYEYQAGAFVDQVGFIDHPRISMAGASPDGLVGADGLLEIKCPQTATHLETLRGAKIPDRYQVQMLWQMACTDRAWCDFASFDPRMPPHLRLFVKRLDRDDERIAEIEAEVVSFLTEIDGQIVELETLYGSEQRAAA